MPLLRHALPPASPLALAALLLVALLGSGSVAAQQANAASKAGAARTEPRFDILSYLVEGDTVLGAAAIERAVYPFLGPDRSVADAESARRALEKAYHDAGFLSVNVVLPPQRVDQGGGELRLQVVQAAVNQLRVTGAQYTLPSQLREALPALAPGQVPDFNEMQRQLADVSRARADREVTPLISAGDQPGTMSVELKVADSLPLHASVELNTKQSQNTTAGRAELELRYDNLFQRGHSVSLGWMGSPTRPTQASIPMLNYSLPLGGVGDRLTLSLLHSNSNTPTALGGGTLSRGTTGRLRWRDELTGIEGANPGISQALTWGLTLRHLRDANQDVAGFSTASPPLDYSTLSLGYELDLGGAATGGVPGRSTRLQAELTVSLAAFNSSLVDCNGTQKNPFDCKRSGASPSFQTLSLQLSHTEPLGRWSLLLRAQGQLADAPLVPSEQVVYGGFDSVRGYYEGEQAGDMGFALRSELSAPSWQPIEQWSLRSLGFIDFGRVKRINALPAEIGHATLASTGLGLRVETTFGLQATLGYARVLRSTQRVASSGGFEPLTGSATGRSQRLDLSLRQSF